MLALSDLCPVADTPCPSVCIPRSCAVALLRCSRICFVFVVLGECLCVVLSVPKAILVSVSEYLLNSLPTVSKILYFNFVFIYCVHGKLYS
jgi:hypothetical protein